MQVEQAVEHPNYDEDSDDYDFLVAKLSGWVDKEVARLPSGGDRLRSGDPLYVIGFGRTSEAGSPSDVLLGTGLDYMDPTECSAVLGNFSYSVPEDTMLCAIGEGKDAYVVHSDGSGS